LQRRKVRTPTLFLVALTQVEPSLFVLSHSFMKHARQLSSQLSPRCPGARHVYKRFPYASNTVLRPKPEAQYQDPRSCKVTQKAKTSEGGRSQRMAHDAKSSDILARPSLAPSVQKGTVLFVLVFSAADSQNQPSTGMRDGGMSSECLRKLLSSTQFSLFLCLHVHSNL
jgi:hypothetical protein